MTSTFDTSTSLASRLKSSKEHLATLAPSELLGVLGAEQARLVATDVATGRIAVGDVLAHAALPDAGGQQVDVLGSGASVVVFYRGAWCPFCNVALSAYQREVLPELERLGVSFVAISPQGPDGTASIAEVNDLSFPVLTDEGGEYARSLGLTFDLADDVSEVHRRLGNDFTSINAGSEWSLPRPTVIVTDADRVVRFVDVRPDYTERTEPSAVLAAVRAVVAG